MTGVREPAKALLLDLDGVLRHYDGAIDAVIEDRHFLEPGAIFRTAMEPARYKTLVTGGWTRAEWLADVGATLGLTSAEVDELAAYRGYVDREVLEFVREVRAAGVPVGLCTNAPRDLADDLAQLGIAEDFDAVANSSDVRYAKPQPEYYRAACVLVRTVPRYCLFVDDSMRNVEGARRVGIAAFRWSGHGDIPYLKAALGL
ncbi:MAG: HAD-IA family hydrolase [Hamadaea sp.]|uniref:HAD family hydrolase n=1 Tax=Hamadaea sp. TaxID=2024425 RepID=UPI0017E6BCA3|nr:HAD-IA family hydrolase [Hamadaea sp.]NUR69762.1 HAD-IA family hydrolase [Hamadaea sp.]NUT20138.1 HAD-IA family hydrolase [Hamadaea sp.]